MQELIKILKYTGFLSHKLNSSFQQFFVPNYCRKRALKKAMHLQSKQCFETIKGQIHLKKQAFKDQPENVMKQFSELPSYRQQNMSNSFDTSSDTEIQLMSVVKES